MTAIFVYNFQTFMMVYARILGLFSVAPVFSGEAITFQMRVVLTFLTSMILYPVIANYLPEVPPTIGEFGLILISELLVGILIGFIISIIFAGFQMAGEYFSLQMGFSYTEVLDPVSQTSLPVVSILKNMLGMMVFLVSGAYRLVFESIAYSFEHIRIINFSNEVNSAIIKTFEYAVGAMFVVAFKISLPVLGVLLLVTIAESLMGKAAPQMNVMQMSFPAKIAAGMIVMVIIMPVIVEQMEEGFNLSFEKVDRLIISWPK